MGKCRLRQFAHTNRIEALRPRLERGRVNKIQKLSIFQFAVALFLHFRFRLFQ